jgi:hypothetical protein
MALVCALCCGGLAGVARAQQQTVPSADQALKKFLSTYLSRADSGPDDTRYASAFVALRGREANEVIVYLTGRQWCGSGGCTALVLVPQGSSYKVNTRMTVAQLPIRVLASRSNGWHDLGVWVQGGGIQPGYEAQLRFNGRKYPGNPTVPPARRLESGVVGQVAIPSTAEGLPLSR